LPYPNIQIIPGLQNHAGENKAKFDEYIESLIKNAQSGNPKAIDAVNKCLEDEIIKVAQTNSAGEDVQPQLIFQMAPNCKPVANENVKEN